MAIRDECSDSSKTGEGRRSSASYGEQIPSFAGTLWQEKLDNPDGINATRGAADMTAADRARRGTNHYQGDNV